MNSPRGQREPGSGITQPSIHLLAEYSKICPVVLPSVIGRGQWRSCSVFRPPLSSRSRFRLSQILSPLRQRQHPHQAAGEAAGLQRQNREQRHDHDHAGRRPKDGVGVYQSTLRNYIQLLDFAKRGRGYNGMGNDPFVDFPAGCWMLALGIHATTPTLLFPSGYHRRH